MKKIGDLKNSFLCALKGLFLVINKERNFKIHIVVSIYVLYFSKYYNLKKIEYLILILTIALVMCLEIVNTVIENIVDYLSPKYSTFAKNTKDIAADGVLVAAILAVIIGLILFLDIDIIIFIIRHIIFCFRNLILFLVSIILSVIFIKKNKY